MNEKILVTGGAGYIGSHVARELIKKGYEVIVYDSLEKGHKESLPKDTTLIEGNLSDKDKLSDVFRKHTINAVMHFANYIEVGESVKNPEKYFKNNVDNGKILLDVMIDNNVKKIIFSSSAAVYGQPKNVPIKEEDEKRPKNPYGEAKVRFEKLLESYKKSKKLKFVSLRYFNAAGADESGKIGEDHRPETHLIPIIIQTILGKRDKFSIFGTDYDTKDGTCIRDYIHVNDIAKAHILALEVLDKDIISNFYNMGNGKGYSVREVINAVEEVTGKKVDYTKDSRREGDPAVLIADYTKIKKELGWKPEHNLKEIIKSAWNWHSKNPDGYKK